MTYISLKQTKDTGKLGSSDNSDVTNDFCCWLCNNEAFEKHLEVQELGFKSAF